MARQFFRWSEIDLWGCWWLELRVGGAKKYFFWPGTIAGGEKNCIQAREVGFFWSGNGLVWPGLDLGSPQCKSGGRELVSGGQNSGPWLICSFGQKSEVCLPGGDLRANKMTSLGQKHRLTRGGLWEPNLYPGLTEDGCPWQEKIIDIKS